MKDSYKSPLFIGAMFLGLGLGKITDQMPAGVLLGIGIGFILTHLFPPAEKNK